MTESSSIGIQTGLSSSGNEQPSVHLSDARRDSLRAAGFSEAQIEALLSLADPDDQGNSLTPNHFYTVDRTTLNSLQYTGQLTETARQIVYVQTPVSMLNQVSDPSNWQADTYVGPGASSVGSFILGEPVDFTKPSLDALVMSVLTARAEIIEEQLREQIEEIQQKNAQLEEANDWLARAKAQKADAGTSDTASFALPTDDSNGVSFRDFWMGIGATHQDGDLHNSADWDVNIEGLKSKIEGLTSQSQLETTKLQQTINKYNQSFEMLSNFINKYYQSLSTIIQNLR